MKRGFALLLLAGAAWCGAQAAPQAPQAVAEIERDAYDDPAGMLQDARAQAAALPAGASAERLRLLVRQVMAAVTLERIDETAAVLQPAQALAHQLQARDLQCLLQLADIAVTGRREAGAAAEERGALVLRQARAGNGVAWCAPRLLLQAGRLRDSRGHRAEALQAMQSAADAFKANGETLMLAVARNDVAWLYRARKDEPHAARRAIELGEAALAGFDPQRQRYLAATVHHNLAGARISAQDWEGARRDADLATHYAQAIGDHLGLAYIGRLQGQIETQARRPARALAHYRAARKGFSGAGLRTMEAWSAAMEAQTLVASGQPAEALRVLADAEPLRARQKVSYVDVAYFRAALDAHAAARNAEATAAAAHAYAEALEGREREDNHRLAAELQERYATAHKEAENQLLRGQQEVQRMRMLALVALLALAGLVLAGLGVHLVRQRRLRARLKRLAEVDELTGLPNRRAILETLNDAAARRRGGRAIAMLDIDHFKRVNDRYGHAAGDAALVTFAQACSRALREGDVMGRLGGEEFLLVLQRARAAELLPLFERMRGVLQASPVAGMPEEERLSFSMGAVDLPAEADTEAALRAADEALYRAKAGGRDRMELGAAAG
jgi:diguanylate cyclase (GGDEF)-like protein